MAFAAVLSCFGVASAEPPESLASLTRRYEHEVFPLLRQYCLDCHNPEQQEGDLDLEHFEQLTTVRTNPGVWRRIVEQLHSAQMPPESAPQPNANQRNLLIDWGNRYLRAEAIASEGDPGPVVLRRLSNAEYTYTLRDLTGIPTLNLASQFPVDGAAGEGFSNAGAALVMSPALLAKYLEAAKEIGRHVVLLPEGVAFSEKVTRRDWTEEKLTAIRDFYGRFSERGGDRSINLQGVQFNTKDAGAIPLERYLKATLVERDALSSGAKTTADVAQQCGLNAKYLALLWQTLQQEKAEGEGKNEKPSMLLDPLRAAWRSATSDEAPMLADMIRGWQQQLWRFSSVGHIGKRDGPKAWQEPALPLASSQAIEVSFPETAEAEQWTLRLVASDAGDGNEGDAAVWRQPRIVLPNQQVIGLQAVESLVQRVDALIAGELPRTVDYLAAVAESHRTEQPLATVADEQELNEKLLRNWAAIVQLQSESAPRVPGRYQNRIEDVGGHAELQGWGSEQTPSLIANRSSEAIQVSTLTVPARAVAMHPSPAQEASVYWKSPFQGEVRIGGLVADADRHCGNGVAWNVQLVTSAGVSSVASGAIDNGTRQSFEAAEAISVRRGDLVRFTVNARSRHHVCDTTHIELTIREVGAEQRVWDLARDIVDTIDQANPLADSFGHPATWHFAASPEEETEPTSLTPGSALAAWRSAVLNDAPTEETNRAARAVQTLLQITGTDAFSAADQTQRKQLLAWHGPLNWLQLAAHTIPSINQAADIETTARSVLTYAVPARLAAGSTFLATAELHPTKGREASVQMRASLTTESPSRDHPSALQPGTILVAEASDKRQQVLKQLDQFRQLFPAALCYVRIVPVDEVVTLRLFYREDEHLRRLMLDDQQAAELDRMWEQLRFISREPVKLVDVYEQLWQYATQDADPSAFEPLREPIEQRAAAFRSELIAAEPRHLDAVVAFAGQAWRRPTTDAERNELRALYTKLREEELPHEEAIRMTLARVLVAPAFLYKLERPQPGDKPSLVSDCELATRLSYFLWSSAPDAELRALTEAGKLQDPQVLAEQADRMRRDERARRLAVEFGCQWLGIRGFDALDEKSERHFPEFAELRNSMYEEAIRFFTDFFQHDRSVLSLLDADHMFVDAALAQFYGLPDTEPSGWRRVEPVQDHGRGGILAMAAPLAKQSGASRTSPILRGHWVYETLLGQQIPDPPPDVPVLADAIPEGLSERELIERHSSDAACANCHAKIDPYGFALENFDAIGRARQTVDTSAALPDGHQLEGLDGLRRYLVTERRDDFVRQFCRKLLGYALGRSVQLSDEPLLDAMAEQLAAHDYRVGVAIEQIVKSRQFRMIRGRDAAAFPSSATAPNQRDLQ